MDFPSPHMVSLLNAVAERGDLLAEVVYCGGLAAERRWGSPVGQLPYHILKGTRVPNGGLHVSIDLIPTMRSMKVDAWVINTCYGSPNTIIAAWWLGRKAVPWVYMNEPPRPRGRWLSAGKRLPLQFVVRRAWGVIGMGEKAVEMYRSLLDGHRPMTSIPYYILLDEFFQLPLPEAPVNRGTLQFLACSQMIHRKGLDILLQACKQLPHRDWQLTLLGDGPLRRKLEEAFSRSFPRERVIFRGEVPFDRRQEAFAGHHVFVHPSRWDGWGMVVPEALAAGLPVVATDRVVAAHEFIRDGINGFIVPAENPGALSERMGHFLHHPECIGEMAVAGRQSLKNYRAETGAERLAQFLNDRIGDSLRRREEMAKPKPSGPLTWHTLTESGTFSQYFIKESRHQARGLVIRAGNMIHRNAQPVGNRILVYHLVLPEDRQSFEDQIKFLRDYFVISGAADILNGYSGKRPGPPYRAVLTFDDGFRVLTEDCLEILEKFNIQASFFVPAAFIDSKPGSAPAKRLSLTAHYYYNRALEPMEPEDLKTLAKLGHDVWSHGWSHVSLRAMSRQQAQRELALSRKRIQEWTGLAPAGFAYPYGHTSSVLGDVPRWVQEAGYSYGFTLRRGAVGAASNPLLLPREHVEGNWPVRDLRFFLMK